MKSDLPTKKKFTFNPADYSTSFEEAKSIELIDCTQSAHSGYITLYYYTINELTTWFACLSMKNLAKTKC